MPAATGTSRSKPLPKPNDNATGVTATGGRVTRLRAKESLAPSGATSAAGSASGSGPGLGTPGRGAPSRAGRGGMTATPAAGHAGGRTAGLLARGKEGLRKVSGKSKEKDKEVRRVQIEQKGDRADGREQAGVVTKTKAAVIDTTSYSESLQAFLRIRPSPAELSNTARPYLEIQSETDVLMRAPMDTSRHHIPKPPHIFSFDRVFPPTTPQSQFFTLTTLPLVERLLQGENGLLFAYGVSNSGKSYTIQGQAGAGIPSQSDRGVLPRSIDVVFNSIEGLESRANLKPQGLADVVLSSDPEDIFPLVDPLAETEPRTEETVKVDRNFSYAVFVSYAEVYNEKIFDLLDSVLPSAPPTPGPGRNRLTNTALPRASHTFGLQSAVNSSFNLAALANGGAGVLKRHALSLKNDPEGNGKYIAGLKDVRVRSREEALAVFRSGQSARQVFGTLANRESSRSHGIFTIKVVRIHNGAPEDPDSAQVSRLAIVDLAGSERTRNTQTTGDRLKEAGNINKSLMVLGQCLEVLRANQQKMALPSTAGMKKKLAVVPFRHSKLTEVFQNFFVGDGRAVIIVNVNPYDTGFDENSHVMRFSATAREIQTTASNKVGFPLLKRQISTQFSAFKQAVSAPMKIKVTVPVIPKPVEGQARAQTQAQGGNKVEPESSKKFAMDRESQGFVMVEEELEVVEEDEESEDEEDKDALVEYLFEQLREMKTRLYESEMRNASIEVEVREKVAKEMQETLQKMHEEFGRQLNEQLAANELKTDRKIDIVTRTMTPAVHRIAHFRPGLSPASSSRMGEDTHGDITMDGDDSFESAIDASLTPGDDSFSSMQSDPFVVKPKQNIPQVIVTSGSGKLSAANVRGSVSRHDASMTESEMTEGETSRGDVTLDSEVPDDDVAAVQPIEVPVSSDEESVLDTDEDDDDDEEEEEEEVELADDDSESEESEGDAEEEEGDSDESAFELSDENDEIESEAESEEPSPKRRVSTKPAATPRKTPGKAGTPAKRGKSATPLKGGVASPVEVMTPGPLSERVGQLQLDTGQGEDEDDDVPVKTTTKKKRTLGKKILTEDEMSAADARSSVAGAEVRRMIRGGM
ncbi:hypothetical protein IAU60_004402 [Kwoniella sp. DSM 27419]